MHPIRLNVSYNDELLPGYITFCFFSDSGEPCDSLPYNDSSVEEIHSANVIEKLTQSEGVRFLKECRRVLKPGGILRTETIHLDSIISNYVEEKANFSLPWIHNNGEMINHLMRCTKNKWIYNYNEIYHLGRLVGFYRIKNISDSPKKNRSFDEKETGSIDNFVIKLEKPDLIKNHVSQPLVSILIAAYNWKYFEVSLRSAIEQSYQNIEIIIGDDSLDDEISRIVQTYFSDGRITYFKNQKNIGERDNYLKCLQKANGDYVKFLNDDDKLETTCIETMLQYFKSDLSISLVTSHRAIIDKDGVVQPDNLATSPIVSKTSILEGTSVVNLMLQAGVNFVGEPSTVLVRKKDLIDIKPHFYDFGGQQGRGAGDVALYLNLLSKGNLVYIHDTLSYFRVHEEQVQQRKDVRELGVKTWEGLRFHAKRLGFMHPNDKNCLWYKDINGSKWRELDYSGADQDALLSEGVHGNGNINHEMVKETILSPYDLWRDRSGFIDSDYNFFSEILTHQKNKTIFNFLLFTTEEDSEQLADTIDSIGTQVYTNWKFTVFADYPCPDPLFQELDQLQWIELQQDHDSSAHEALMTVKADWIIKIKPGDLLDPAFLYFLYFYTEDNPAWKFIYTDEDTIDAEGKFVSPKFKPDFNLDLARSMNYLGAACIVQRETLSNIGITDWIKCLSNYDLFFRIYDMYGKETIGHIPSLLFHSRTSHEINIDKIKEQEISSLKEHLIRNDLSFIINDGFIDNTNFIIYQHSDEPHISIIIPSKNNISHLQQCIFSILEKTEYKNYEIIIVDNNSTEPATVSFLKTIAVSHPNIRVLHYKKPFNYSAINNFAVNEANGEFILLLNDDTIVLQGSWLDRMLQQAQRTDVGAVGARLLYSNQQLQHAGVVLGLNPLAHHVGIGQDMKEPGYMNRLQVVQNFTAVTAACLLVNKTKYLEVGGLDETKLKVLFNDVDFCIKLTEAGYRNVWTPHATLIHHGSSSLRNKKSKKEVEKSSKRATQEYQTMRERWGDLLTNDPSYNRNLSLQALNWDIDAATAVPWDTSIIERPRFVGVPNTSAGCALYRVSEPLRHLRKAGVIWESVLSGFESKAFDMPSVINLKRMAPDTLLLHTIFCKKDLLQDYKRYTNTCLIYGMDDLIMRLPKDHPNKSLIPKDVNKLLRNMLDVSDRLIVSTEPLYDYVKKKKMIDDVRVIPNCLSGDIWQKLKPLKRQGQKVRIGWAGALQHHGDLAVIETVVKETQHEVDWVFLGMCPDYLRPYVKEFHPAVNINEYPQKLASLNLDIAVAPLEINPFNEAKSNLRLLEYGVLGIPVIATDIFPYRNSPAVVLENDPQLWISAIRERIDQPSAAEKEGEILKRWVFDNYLLENNAELWLEALTP